MNKLICSVEFPTLYFSPGLKIAKTKNSEEACRIFEKFSEGMENTKGAIHTLVEKNVVKLHHCPLSIKQIFIFYVEESLDNLRQHAPLDKTINDAWTEIKVFIAEDSYEPKDLEFHLTNFLKSLEVRLQDAGIKNPEFSQIFLLFAKMFHRPFVTSASLISFFEKDLHWDVAKLQFNKMITSKGLLTNLAVSLPFSGLATLKSAEILFYRYRSNLEWIDSFCKKQIKDIKSQVPKLVWQNQSHENVEAILNITLCCDAIRRFNLSIQQHSKFIYNPKKFCVYKSKIEGFKTLIRVYHEGPTFLEIETNLSPDIVNLLKKCNQMLQVIQVYGHEMSIALYTQSASIEIAIKQLKIVNVGQLRKGIDAPISIQEFYKFKLDPNRPKIHAPKPSKNARKRAKKEELKKFLGEKELENNTPQKVQKAARVQRTKKTRKEPAVIALDQIGAALLDHSRLCKTDARDALVQSHWHLSKCMQLHRIALTEPLSSHEYLNIFAAYVFSAAISIEQVYRYLMITKEISDDTHRFHNILDMHKMVFSNQTPKAVETLKLAIDWSRRFYEMKYRNLNSSSFHENKMPPVLELLNLFASDFDQVSLESFQITLNQIQEELIKALSTITSFAQNSENVPHLEQPVQSLINCEISSFAPIIPEMQLLSSPDNFNLNQATENLRMLDQSIARLLRADTYESFSLWATRSLFLIEESTDFTLRALDTYKNGSTITKHNIGKLAERTGIQIPHLAEALVHMSMKLKYPASMQVEGIGSELVDQIEAICHYPELEMGAEIAKSALIPGWKIPLKGVSREEILLSIKMLAEDLKKMIEDQVLPAFTE